MRSPGTHDLRGAVALLCYSVAPGVALAAFVAVLAAVLENLVTPVFSMPPIVAALLLGLALHPLALRAIFARRLMLCVKIVLRWAIALLGLRVSVGDIAARGITTAAMIMGAMVI